MLPGNNLKERVEYFADWDYNIKVAGVSFRRKELDELYEKDWNKVKVEIKEEPENKFDPNAIAIYADNVHIGYISAIVVQPVKQLIKQGHNYECALIYVTNGHRGKGIRTAKIALKEK